MTKALPCINTQQKAAKTISKDQQTHVFYCSILNTLRMKNETDNEINMPIKKYNAII